MSRILARTGLVLGLLACSVACPSKEDPETLIRRAIESAARAAEEKDVGGVMEIVSEKVQARGMGHTDIKRAVFAQLRVGDWQKVMLVRTVVALVDETTANAETTVVLARGGTNSLEEAVAGNSGTYRFILGFSKEGSDWKVVSVEYRSASLKNLLGVE